MNFKREETRDYYLLDTEVENIFINEYMASAPGDYVKVYLFSLMYADVEQEMSNEITAKQLGLQEEDVLKAWTYWEKMGVIKKNYRSPEEKFNYQVEFLNLKERLYGKSPKKKQSALEDNDKKVMADKNVQSMFQSIERVMGKALSGSEMMEILSWINEFHAAPEVIVYGYSYCKSKNKKNIKYVGAVIKQWSAEGLKDVVAVEEYLQNTDQRHYLYKRICKAMGFARNLTEEEERIVSGWFDQMEYSIDKVLEACALTSGISNPNINYVNKVLVNWYEEKTGTTPDGKAKPVSMALVNKYLAYLREQAESQVEERRKEVYDKVPELKKAEEEMNTHGMMISKVIISDRADKKAEIKRLQGKIDNLSRMKAYLLTDNDFEMDYMDIKYKCAICKDTGMNENGERCECIKQRTKEAEAWQTNLVKS